MEIFSIFLNMKVCCVFSLNRLIEAILMSTHNILFSIYKMKITLNYLKPVVLGFVERDSSTSSKQPW